jgi:hypothetical protein
MGTWLMKLPEILAPLNSLETDLVAWPDDRFRLSTYYGDGTWLATPRGDRPFIAVGSALPGDAEKFVAWALSVGASGNGLRAVVALADAELTCTTMLLELADDLAVQVTSVVPLDYEVLQVAVLLRRVDQVVMPDRFLRVDAATPPATNAAIRRALSELPFETYRARRAIHERDGARATAAALNEKSAALLERRARDAGDRALAAATRAATTREEQLRDRLFATRSELREMRHRVAGLESSVSFQLGHALVEIATKPSAIRRLPRIAAKAWKERGEYPPPPDLPARRRGSKAVAPVTEEVSSSWGAETDGLRLPLMGLATSQVATVSHPAVGPWLCGRWRLLHPNTALVALNDGGVDLVVIDASAGLVGSPWFGVGTALGAHLQRCLIDLVDRARYLGIATVFRWDIDQRRAPSMRVIAARCDAQVTRPHGLDLGLVLGAIGPEVASERSEALGVQAAAAKNAQGAAEAVRVRALLQSKGHEIVSVAPTVPWQPIEFMRRIASLAAYVAPWMSLISELPRFAAAIAGVPAAGGHAFPGGLLPAVGDPLGDPLSDEAVHATQQLVLRDHSIYRDEKDLRLATGTHIASPFPVVGIVLRPSNEPTLIPRRSSVQYEGRIRLLVDPAGGSNEASLLVAAALSAGFESILAEPAAAVDRCDVILQHDDENPFRQIERAIVASFCEPTGVVVQEGRSIRYWRVGSSPALSASVASWLEAAGSKNRS